MYHFWGHCGLDLVSRIIMSGTYPILFEVGTRIGSMDVSLDGDMSHIILGHCDLDLASRIIMYGAYPILFEVGIPNLVCGFLFGWLTDAYHFGSL